MNAAHDFQQQFAERATRRITGIVTKVLMAIIFVTVAIFVFGEIVFRLWNWLVPSLFHLSALTSFWQAIGLMILSWLLFGGLRGFGRRGFGPHGPGREALYGRWRDRMQQRMRDRWEQMTPEERDKFREWIQSRPSPSEKPL
jgi:hypothetical protein